MASGAKAFAMQLELGKGERSIGIVGGWGVSVVSFAVKFGWRLKETKSSW